MKNHNSKLTDYLPVIIRNYLDKKKIESEYKRWLESDRQLSKLWENDKNYVPVPHHVKENTIKEIARKYSLKIFVETGTYMGTMVESLQDEFDSIISIELSEKLAARAKMKFKSISHIVIIQGDSGEKVSEFLAKLKKPTLFWLDGHYSGGVTAKAEIETPILKEVENILNDTEKRHAVLIDDARLFNGTRDYPTHEELKQFVSKFTENYSYEVRNDIIIILRN